MLDVKGKSVLITGCDSGFGNRTALRLAKLDMKVFAGCITTRAVQELNNQSPNIVAFLMDVTKEFSIEEAFEKLKKECPEGLWGLINNAGVLRGGPLELAPKEDWKLQFDVNVFGLVDVSRTFLPLLKKAKGRLVNIASVAGRVSTHDVSAYSASKYAVEAVSDAWRQELKPWGVTVVIIEPGIMKTPLWDVPFDKSVAKKQWDSLSEDKKLAYGEEYFEAGHKAGKEMVEKLGGNPEEVVDALELAVTAARPLHRYTVGKDTPIWIILSYLPSYVFDYIYSLLPHPIPQALKTKS